MKIDYENLIIDTEIIGGFKIDEKEYAVLSYIDSNENAKIVIVEVYRNKDKLEAKNIKEEEMDLVLQKYREIESKLLEVSNNE